MNFVHLNNTHISDFQMFLVQKRLQTCNEIMHKINWKIEKL